MGSQGAQRIFSWLKTIFSVGKAPPDEIARARELLAAIDRGGIPLNTARINAIARDFGLEVARDAPVENTILRIRQALARATGN